MSMMIQSALYRNIQRDLFRGEPQRFISNIKVNHEDSLLLSESFLERAKVRLSEKVYIPVFEYTILLPSYNDVEGSLKYFPNVGQKIHGNVVCSVLKPSSMRAFESLSTIKTKMTRFYNSLTISDLLNLNNESTQAIKVDGITSKIKGGKVTGISVHKLYKKEVPQLIDGKLQKCLDKLVNMQTDESIIAPFNDLQYKINRDYAKQIIKNYMMYIPDTISANASMLKNAKYLIELEITRESGSQKGDKFANRL